MARQSPSGEWEFAMPDWVEVKKVIARRRVIAAAAGRVVVPSTAMRGTGAR